MPIAYSIGVLRLGCDCHMQRYALKMMPAECSEYTKKCFSNPRRRIWINRLFHYGKSCNFNGFFFHVVWDRRCAKYSITFCSRDDECKLLVNWAIGVQNCMKVNNWIFIQEFSIDLKRICKGNSMFVFATNKFMVGWYFCHPNWNVYGNSYSVLKSYILIQNWAIIAQIKETTMK